jgi:hypothetical protein
MLLFTNHLTIRDCLAVHQPLDHPRLPAFDTSDTLRDEAGEQNHPGQKQTTQKPILFISKRKND